MPEDLFPTPPERSPKIYAYTLPVLPTHEGCIKIGFTTCDPDQRIHEQTRTVGVKPRKILVLPALRADGSSFTDHDVHAVMKTHGFRNMIDGEGLEWFRCTRDDVIGAVCAVRDRTYSYSKHIKISML